MTQAIDYIPSVDTFEQQYVVLKGMLQSPHIKDHTKIIGIDQSLSNIYYFEYKHLNNIKKMYQHAGKCDYQQEFKYIPEAAMVSTPEEITDKSPSFPMTKTTVKNQVPGITVFIHQHILC